MSEVVHTELINQRCPACGGALDIASGLDTPLPGSLLLCAYCTVWLVLDEPIRILSNREWLRLSTEYKTFLTGMRERFIASGLMLGGGAS